MSIRGTGSIPGNAASVNNTERGVDRGSMDSGFSRPAIASYGLPEAPIDGNEYVRKDGQWFIFSGSLSASDAVPSRATDLGSPGVSQTYSRGDHIHPAPVIADITGLQTTLDNLTTKNTEQDGDIAAVESALAGKVNTAGLGASMFTKLVEGTNITISYDAGTDSITLSSSGQGGGSGGVGIDFAALTIYFPWIVYVEPELIGRREISYV